MPLFVGTFIGTILSYIAISPDHPVDGTGIEEILSRAAYYIDCGDLESALNELNGIQGYGRVLLSDWTALANDRLLIDQSAKALRARIVTLHTSLV